MIKRILVGLGGTPYTDAEISHGIDLALAHQAELNAVAVVDLARLANVGPVPLGASAAAADLVTSRIGRTHAAIDEAARSLRDVCRASGVTHHLFIEAGAPTHSLKDLWRYHDLTIVALRGLFEYGVVHDPLDLLIEIIADGVRPILAVARAPRKIRRVVVAYNGSMESAKAMKQFAQTRLWPDAEVTVACFELPDHTGHPLLRDAREYLELHGYRVQTHSSRLDPREDLLPYAAAIHADLIVLGATARSRIMRRIMGDVALHLIKHSPVPLFMTQ